MKIKTLIGLLSVLIPCLITAQDFTGLTSQPLQVNGRQLVYYPELTVGENTSNAGAQPLSSGNATTVDPNYGKFNGLPIIKKQPASNVARLSTKLSGGVVAVRANSHVLYNQTEQKFEITDGLIQLEVDRSSVTVPFDSIYNLTVISRQSNYLIVKAKGSTDFVTLYNQLLTDKRFKQVQLMLHQPQQQPN